MSTAKSPHRLTVALIVRDAAEALRETLASVQAIADELIVFDTGSQDATRDVATEFGATTVSHTWKDDFSEARNACWEHITGDWVLWMDAGESFESEDAKSLRRFVDEEANSMTAYAMLVRVPPAAPGGAGEQIARIRLMPTNRAIQYQGRIRESVVHSLEQNNLNVDALPYRIRRGTREHELAAKTEKARRNIRLCERDIRERGVSASLLNALGDAFQTLKDDDRALECFRHGLKASSKGSIEMLEAYYGIVTSMDGDASKRDAQLATCVEALEIYPLDAQLLCAMGGYLHAQNRSDVALKAYETAFRFGQVNPAVWHVDEIREIAVICYSIALQLEDRMDEAQSLLEEASESSPSNVRLRRHMIDFYVKRGDRDRALAQIGHLPKETPYRESLRSAVRGACLAAQQNWIAAKAYLKTAYAAGCRDGLCLRWLATTHMAAGEIDQARPLIQQWVEAEPHSPEAARYMQTLQQTDAPPADRQLRVDAPGTDPIARPASTDHRAPSHRLNREYGS